MYHDLALLPELRVKAYHNQDLGAQLEYEGTLES